MLKQLACKSRLLSVPLLRHRYHVLSLLDDKHNEQNIKINPKLFHLYLDKLTTQPFNERYTAIIIMDCFRTNRTLTEFKRVLSYVLDNLHQFKGRQSLIQLLLQMYRYQYNNKEDVMKVAKATFGVKEDIASSNSYFNMRFLIVVDQLIGLGQFSEEELRGLHFQKFRPILLAMVIELFYKNKLQGKMGLTE